MKKLLTTLVTLGVALMGVPSPATADVLDITPESVEAIYCAENERLSINVNLWDVDEFLRYVGAENGSGITYEAKFFDGSTQLTDYVNLSTVFSWAITRGMSTDFQSFDYAMADVDLLNNATDPKFNLKVTVGFDNNTRFETFTGDYDLNVFDEFDQLTGAGSAADPYILNSPEDLNALRCLDLYEGRFPSGNFAAGDTYIELANDLDMSGFNSSSGFLPLNSASIRLDGNGYKISNLKLTSHDEAGLFRQLQKSSIKNLIFENPVVYGDDNFALLANECRAVEIRNVQVIGAQFFAQGGGTLCADVDESSIENVKVQAVMTLIPTEFSSYSREDVEPAFRVTQTGGLIGGGENLFIDSVEVDFKVQTNTEMFLALDEEQVGNQFHVEAVGGVVGDVDDRSTLENVTSTFEADISGAGRVNRVGGITGQIGTSVMNRTRATVDIAIENIESLELSTSTVMSVGGLVGELGTSSIFNSRATGDILIDLEGNANGYITNVGSVSGHQYDANQMRQIAADVAASIVAEKVDNVGLITGKWDEVIAKDVAVHSNFTVETFTEDSCTINVGSFAGNHYDGGAAERVITTGELSVDSNCTVEFGGPAIGDVQENRPLQWKESFWNTDKVSDLGPNTLPYWGEGASTTELKSAAFFKNLSYDFENVWEFDSRTGFPTIRDFAAERSSGLKSQASKNGRIAFSEIGKDNKRRIAINLESRFAGQTATVRIKRSGDIKLLGQVRLSKLGNQIFRSGVKIKKGDIIQVVVNKKVRQAHKVR